ncbi:hypothetical protein EXIGLDRAFT_717436 [Exidia glandulosa HHB12029]|uniref:Uncharacterized protein n=1 Tax=Exidia glandulosa HHB12029 TaxID=1314781 RepID=A0A166MPT2_EXIGL|nr:hypothetical protein EXIGLDRAFT_717436 [Exidia glandulosa HHB12029]
MSESGVGTDIQRTPVDCAKLESERLTDFTATVSAPHEALRMGHSLGNSACAFPSRTTFPGRDAARTALHASGVEITMYSAPLTPPESRAHVESVKIASAPSQARTHLPRSCLLQSRPIRVASYLRSVA